MCAGFPAERASDWEVSELLDHDQPVTGDDGEREVRKRSHARWRRDGRKQRRAQRHTMTVQVPADRALATPRTMPTCASVFPDK